MFWSRKAKGRKVAIKAVAVLVNELRARAGIPEGFWNDAYVLGYLHACAGGAARTAIGKMPESKMGEIIYDALAEVSGGGAEVRKRVVTLETGMAGPDDDADFLRGFQAATWVSGVADGQTRYDAVDVVVGARSAAAALNGLLAPEPGNPSNVEVATLMEMLLFKDVVLDRLESTPTSDVPWRPRSRRRRAG